MHNPILASDQLILKIKGELWKISNVKFIDFDSFIFIVNFFRK